MRPLGKLLITGGTGFFGNNLAMGLKPYFSEIVLCSRRFTKDRQEDIFQYKKLDITDRDAVQNTIKETRPDYIIHAAAVKSVAYAESNPLECIQTNIYGSENIALAAAENQVKAVIGISSIRASSPVRGMYAMSKSIMEKLFYHFSSISSTHFISLRLGNLAWSPGSVLKEWEEMLNSSGFIRTSGYDMSRFFIDVEEAVSYVRIICENSIEFSSNTVVPDMKIARIGDVLEKFILKYGGRYERMRPLSVEKIKDQLIGSGEEKNSKRLIIAGQTFYLIGNQASGEDWAESFEPLEMTASEIESMVNKRSENKYS
jgi:FlaA1/EpsC-like NDP-sugar epimerase